MALLKINLQDTVAVALHPMKAGETLPAGEQEITAKIDIPTGHKIALQAISKGEKIIKYGCPIGFATEDIQKGEWVHTQNLKTTLGDLLDYQFNPHYPELPVAAKERTFQGYLRKEGKPGIRNEVWIIPLVGCVNANSQIIVEEAKKKFAHLPNVDGFFALTHPHGCSQLGQDHENTRQVLIDLINQPNAGGILVFGLGCENNYMAQFKEALGTWDEDRVKFLVAQEVEDEIEEGLKLVGQLAEYASKTSRTPIDAKELVIGLKCGGSDGFSGLTANPLLGVLSDLHLASGGSTVLTEVPEMFGAEQILMDRAENKEIFDKTVDLINDFKTYFNSYNQPIYENPSPGNKEGGISSLEDKSLGCVQKGGVGIVTDVIPYGGRVTKPGLTLLSGPGNDLVACSALAAAGCHMVLFTTGRGNPMGSVVPTVKVATNSELATKKANWIDYNAGRLLEGVPMDELAEDFFGYLLKVASGELTKAEKLGAKDLTIFKNGVTL
jgi:altronate hydrolase